MVKSWQFDADDAAEGKMKEFVTRIMREGKRPLHEEHSSVE